MNSLEKKANLKFLSPMDDMKKERAENTVPPQMEEYIRERINIAPRTAIILGSGLGQLAGSVTDPVCISYKDIPFYPSSGVEGHTGELITGTIGKESVLVASGRFHLYEGYDMSTVTLPVRLFHRLGIVNLIITNAAGSVREDYSPGTLVGIDGHIDFTFRESVDTPRIVRDGKYHSERLLALAEAIARRESIELKKGVYSWALGPSFETPAEIGLIRELGGDAVGMSTVPEIREAGELGLEVLTISCVTNYAAGITPDLLTHEEVMEVTRNVSQKFNRLLTGIVSEITAG